MIFPPIIQIFVVKAAVNAILKINPCSHRYERPCAYLVPEVAHCDSVDEGVVLHKDVKGNFKIEDTAKIRLCLIKEIPAYQEIREF